MADDNSARHRSNDSFGRAPAQGASANDPLAELARLIGQSDTFPDYGRAQPQPSHPQQQPDPSARYGGEALPSFLSQPAPQYGDDPAPSHPAEPAPSRYVEQPPSRYVEPPPPRYSEPAQPAYVAAPAQRYAEAPPQYGNDPARYNSDFAAHNDWPGQPAPGSPYPPQHYDHQSYGDPNYAAQGYPGQGYAQQGNADQHAHPSESYQHGGFGPSGHPGSADRQGYGAPLYPHEPDAGGMPPPHDDEFYDDEPRGGRRRGLLTIAAVLALAVVGTAGAFGYRSIFGGPGSSGPVPVIRASGEPSKVAPPPQAADQSASKFSYDRFGDAGKDEQVVRREEKPVDLSKVAPPRSAPSTGPGAAQSRAGGSALTDAANPPSAIGEPRRVRTVPIRPDQPDVAPAVSPMQSTAPMSVMPPRQANAAPAAAAPDNSAPRAAAPPKASSRVALRSAPAAQQPQAVANAPLSLSPDANNAPPAQDTAPPPPPAPRAAAPAPTRVASAPSSGGGSYLVQVSSQRSEADAESAYRGIQSKFSGVLATQPHTVRRADLGTKGTFYRAMVGPFASREQAVQLCSSLKQAGGDCVVQH